MTHSDAFAYTYFTISCGLSTISIASVSVVDLSFVFVLLWQSIDSLDPSHPLSLLGRRGLV